MNSQKYNRSVLLCYLLDSLWVVVCNRFIPFSRGQSQLSLGEGRVLPGQVASSSQDPHWWQRLPCKVPTAPPGAIWGSVSCSRTLRHAAQLSLELEFEPVTFWSVADLLYLPSYSHTWPIIHMQTALIEKTGVKWFQSSCSLCRHVPKLSRLQSEAFEAAMAVTWVSVRKSNCLRSKWIINNLKGESFADYEKCNKHNTLQSFFLQRFKET